MKLFTLLFLFVLLTSCNRPLKEPNLIIPNPELDGIKKYGISQMLIYCKPEPPYFRDTLIKYFGEERLNDTLNALLMGYKTFDKSGNIIEDKVYEFMGTYQYFKYDSLGRLIDKIYDTDFSASFQITYKYNEGSKKAFQIWSYGEDKDTTMFNFDTNGYLLKEQGYLHDDKSSKRTYLTIYKYTDGNKLNIKKTSFQNDYNDLMNKIEVYYYKGPILSKKTTTYKYGNKRPEWIKAFRKEIVYYDSKGLPFEIHGLDPLPVHFIINK